jgi:hypothetical protein
MALKPSFALGCVLAIFTAPLVISGRGEAYGIARFSASVFAVQLPA